MRLSQLFWYLDGDEPTDGDLKSRYSHLDITEDFEALRRQYRKGLTENKISRLKDEIQFQLQLSESEQG